MLKWHIFLNSYFARIKSMFVFCLSFIVKHQKSANLFHPWHILIKQSYILISLTPILCTGFQNQRQIVLHNPQSTSTSFLCIWPKSSGLLEWWHQRWWEYHQWRRQHLARSWRWCPGQRMQSPVPDIWDQPQGLEISIGETGSEYWKLPAQIEISL